MHLFHKKRNSIFLVFIFSLTACTSFHTTQSEWVIKQSNNSPNPYCVLHSKPIPFSTTAGIDSLIIHIDNNNLVSMKMSQENLRLARPEAILIYVDDNPPITTPSLSSQNSSLVFDKSKSKQLLEMFNSGELAYIKLGLPIINDTSTPRLALTGFHEALIELRLCNVFTEREKKTN